MMAKRNGLGRLAEAGVISSILIGAAPFVATAAIAEPADWCKAIADGVFCAATAAEVPHFCGTKKISVALADGFADNPWRQMTTAAAINEASQCPNVTSFTHTNGQGSTQKAISDIAGLVARGTDAIVMFADAGPAMLPALRDAVKEGSVVVPYRSRIGGKEGVDYTVFIGTDFFQDGVDWGTWMVKALNGKGNVAYLGGTPGNAADRERSDGVREAFKGHPEMKWIGLDPFEITNWDSSVTAKVLAALITKYPQIDGIVADQDIPIVTSGAFERANRPLPKVAGEDGNALGCAWQKIHATDPNSAYQLATNSAEPWNVRLAVRWGIALAAGGKVDQPLIINDPSGKPHVVAKPGDKIAENFPMDDTLQGIVFCEPGLPPEASNGTSLTVPQVLRALKGGL